MSVVCVVSVSASLCVCPRVGPSGGAHTTSNQPVTSKCVGDLIQRLQLRALLHVVSCGAESAVDRTEWLSAQLWQTACESGFASLRPSRQHRAAQLAKLPRDCAPREARRHLLRPCSALTLRWHPSPPTTCASATWHLRPSS